MSLDCISILFLIGKLLKYRIHAKDGCYPRINKLCDGKKVFYCFILNSCDLKLKQGFNYNLSLSGLIVRKYTKSTKTERTTILKYSFTESCHLKFSIIIIATGTLKICINLI